MDMQKVTHEIRLRQWIGIIKECRGSGMTVKDWCADKGILTKTFYYWQRKVREAACQELTAYQEQQVTKAESGDSTPVFAECRIPEDSHAGGIAITIHLNDAVVEIHHGAEASVIESTVRALRIPC